MKTEDIIVLIIGVSLGCTGGIIGAVIGVLSSKDKIKYHKVLKNLSWVLMILGAVSICATFLLSTFHIIDFDHFISIFWISLLVIFIGGWPLFINSKTKK